MIVAPELRLVGKATLRAILGQCTANLSTSESLPVNYTYGSLHEEQGLSLSEITQVRYWATVAIATVLPGLLAAVIEYVWTQGVSGWAQIMFTLIGGLGTMTVLWYVQGRKRIERSKVAFAIALVLFALSLLAMVWSLDRSFHRDTSTARQEHASPNEVVEPASTFEPKETAVSPSKPQGMSASPVESRDSSESGFEGKRFSPRTLKELVDSVEGLTEIAADKVSERHIGLWLSVEGSVIDIREMIFSDNLLAVQMSVSENDASAVLYCDKKRWGQLLNSVDVGDQMTAIGRIASIGRYRTISLDECELTNQQP